VTPTKLSQGQAARAACVSRTTIWRAMKDGRLSFEKVDDGSFRIDASELARVFPDARFEQSDGHARVGHANEHDGRTSNEHSALRELVHELRADKMRLQTELDRAADERARLLTMLGQQTEQIKLLTDQRPVPVPPPGRSLVARIFGRA
jgi:hypothetical protein